MSVIAIKDAGKIIPREFLDYIVNEKKHAGCVGGATIDDGAIDPTQLVGSVDLDQLMEIQKACEADRVVLFFGETTEWDTNDVPPFTLISDAKERPVLVAFITGEFPDQLEGRETKHTSAFFLASDIHEAVTEYVELCESDFDKIIAHLQKPIVEKNMRNLMGSGSGTITMFGADDSCWSYTKEDTGKTMDWGWCSNTLGYSEKKAEPEPEPAPTKGKSKLQLKAAGGGAKPVTKKPDPAPAKETESDEDPAAARQRYEDTLETIDTDFERFKRVAGRDLKATKEQVARAICDWEDDVDDDEFVKILSALEPKAEPIRFGKCPSEITGKDKIEQWYRNNEIDGTVPNKSWKKPVVALKADSKALSVEPPDHLKKKYAGSSGYRPFNEAKEDLTSPKKDTTTHNLPVVPALTEMDIKNINAVWKPKFLDVGSKRIIDPKTIGTAEWPYPHFHEKMGWKDVGLEYVFQLDYPGLVDLAKTKPEAVALVTLDLIEAYGKVLNEKPAEATPAATKKSRIAL